MHSRLLLFCLLAVVLIVGLLLPWDELVSGLREADEGPAQQPPPDALRSEVPTEAQEPGLEGRAADPANADAAVRRGDVEVVVLGRGLEPFPGVHVGVRTLAKKGIGPLVGLPVPTAFDGRVVLKDLPYDGSHVLHFYEDDPYRRPGRVAWRPLRRQGDGARTIPITGPRHVFAATTGFWLTVRAVDSETGRNVNGARLRGHMSREKGRDAWVTAPARFYLAPAIGRDAHIGFTTAPKKGWSLWEANEVTTRISPYARELVYVYPMRRELPLTVALVDAEGRAVEAVFKALSIGGRKPRQLRWDTDAFGRLVFEGVPWLRDELVLLEVASKDEKHLGLDLFRIPAEMGARITRTVPVDIEGLDLEEIGEPDVSLQAGVGGGRLPGRSAHVHDNALEVTVLRHDGTPAAGCLVRLAGPAFRRPVACDAKGRARFTNLAPGAWKAEVREPGLLPMVGTTMVPASGTRRVTLRESVGATVHVEVVDDEGKPLSYATLALFTTSKLPWLDLRDGVQRLDPFTDHLGRRTLTHVEPGTVTIAARWGSRGGQKRVDLTDASAHAVRIVLRKPAKFDGEGK